MSYIGNDDYEKNKKQDSIAARRAWTENAGGLGLTQRRLSKLMGYSPSYLSGALNGNNAWPEPLKLKYSRALGKLPQEIWPDWPYAAMTCGKISDKEYRIILFYRDCDAERQMEIELFVECKFSAYIRGKTRKPR